MHLVSFITDGKLGIGAVDWNDRTLVDLSRCDSELPSDMLALIAMGAEGHVRRPEPLRQGYVRLRESPLFQSQCLDGCHTACPPGR